MQSLAGINVRSGWQRLVLKEHSKITSQSPILVLNWPLAFKPKNTDSFVMKWNETISAILFGVRSRLKDFGSKIQTIFEQKIFLSN